MKASGWYFEGQRDQAALAAELAETMKKFTQYPAEVIFQGIGLLLNN